MATLDQDDIDAILDEALAGHNTAGTVGAALNFIRQVFTGAGGSLTLTIGTVTIDGGGVNITYSAGPSGNGVTITGNGTGHGIAVTGGAAGVGFLVTGAGGAPAVKFVGTNDDALKIEGGNSHHGIYVLGGAIAGNAIKAEATANSAAILVQGHGTGEGMRCVGGATGNGIVGQGGATSGDAIKCIVVSGDGFDGTMASTVVVPRVTLVDTTTDLTNSLDIPALETQEITNGVIAGLAGSVISPRTYVQREHVELYRGDSYQNSEGTGRNIPFTKAETETHWPTMLDTVHLYVVPTAAAIADGRATALQRLDDIAGTITQSTGDQAFYFNLTAAQTEDLSDEAEPHDYVFQIVANKADHPATLREGTFSARQTIRTLA